MSIDVSDRESLGELDEAAISSPPEYRSLSAAAVATLILGLLSSLALLDWFMGMVPAITIVLGIYAVRKLRRQNSEFTGLGLATAGLALAVAFWAIGVTRLSYIYATELPEGYERLSYDELQPDPLVPNELFPPSAVQLDGKRVFVKGYAYPGNRETDIQTFILCRDQGDCCFGGNPKLTDRILVHLVNPLRFHEHSRRLVRLAGTFRIVPTAAPDGMGQIIYHLQADYLQ